MACADRLQIISGDITRRTVDAIVNAANSSLLGGGGVDGAIHNAGGPEILRACKEIRATTYPDGLPPGDAVATTGGTLTARHVVHTVGPVWHGGSDNEESTLTRAIDSCFSVAAQLQVGSIAFPAISTGVYRFPKELAFRIILQRICANLALHDSIRLVEFVLFSETDRALCASVFSDSVQG